MQNLLIYGTAQDFTPLLDHARAAALRAYRLVANNWQVIVSDRHGLDAEVARTCCLWDIPLKVCGLAVRPRNGASLRHYERVLACPVYTTAENLLNRYLMNMAQRVVVLGDSPDCQAMRLWARLNRKLCETTQRDTVVRPLVITPLARWSATQKSLIVH